MNRRRFMLLTVTLVVLNAAFWLAQGGLALPGVILNQFFGNSLVRAEVIVQVPGGSTQDYRIDRGVITTVSGTTPALTLTVREKDGTIDTVQLDPNTLVRGPAGRVLPAVLLRRRFKVVVVRVASATTAQLVQVEGIGG